MAVRHRQRGWVGLVVILLALAIVALVARTALKQYGLLDDPAKLSYVGREASASPATGSYSVHQREQGEIVSNALKN